MSTFIPGVYVGFIGDRTRPAPQAPRKAIGNSGMFGRTVANTSPVLAPILNIADPNFLDMPATICLRVEKRVE